jgi:hypothetical protein
LPTSGHGTIDRLKRFTAIGRYFFHLHECGTVIPDEEGRELAGHDAVRQAALAAARDLMAAEVQAGRLCLGCCIQVTDESGRVAVTVNFREALTLSGL